MKNYTFITLTFYLIICSTSMAQTITYKLDYSSQQVSTRLYYDSACVFRSGSFPANDTPTNTSRVHTWSWGNPLYSNKEKALVLPSAVRGTNGNKFDITEYAVLFPFKKGKHYKIRMNCKSSFRGNIWGSMLFYKISNTKGTTSACGQIAQADYDWNLYNGGYAKQNLTQTQFKNYQYTDYLYTGPIDQDYQYLLVGAQPEKNAGYFAFKDSTFNTYIKNIEIIESPPISVSSSKTVANCDFDSTVTFTVNNTGSVAGINAYEWDFGVENNGWYYNNLPAPRIITTSGNSITLSFNCSSPTLNLVAGAVTPTLTFKADKLIVEAKRTSIAGVAEFCTGAQTYSIQNAPPGAVTSWSISDPSILSIVSSNSASASLTRGENAGFDAATLTAVVNYQGKTLFFNRSIRINCCGSIQLSDFLANGPNIEYSDTAYFDVVRIPAGLRREDCKVSWHLHMSTDPSVATVIPSRDGFSAKVVLNPGIQRPASVTLNAWVDTPCGKTKSVPGTVFGTLEAADGRYIGYSADADGIVQFYYKGATHSGRFFVQPLPGNPTATNLGGGKFRFSPVQSVVRADVRFFNDNGTDTGWQSFFLFIPGSYFPSTSARMSSSITTNIQTQQEERQNETSMVEAEQIAMTIQPNPAISSALISFRAIENQAVDLKITSTSGKLQFHRSLDVIAGVNKLQINTQGWQSGVYIVTVIMNKGMYSKKFIVRK